MMQNINLLFYISSWVSDFRISSIYEGAEAKINLQEWRFLLVTLYYTIECKYVCSCNPCFSKFLNLSWKWQGTNDQLFESISDFIFSPPLCHYGHCHYCQGLDQAEQLCTLCLDMYSCLYNLPGANLSSVEVSLTLLEKKIVTHRHWCL